MTRRPAHPTAPRRGHRPTPRGAPHLPQEDPDAPGCCRICKRPLDAKTDRHLKALPETDPDALAEERRRLGDRDE